MICYQVLLGTGVTTSLSHTFILIIYLQVVYASKKSGFVTLYIIATTKEECSDWVATLRQGEMRDHNHCILSFAWSHSCTSHCFHGVLMVRGNTLASVFFVVREIEGSCIACVVGVRVLFTKSYSVRVKLEISLDTKITNH